MGRDARAARGDADGRHLIVAALRRGYQLDDARANHGGLLPGPQARAAHDSQADVE
jgi:hypothetical protein